MTRPQQGNDPVAGNRSQPKTADLPPQSRIERTALAARRAAVIGAVLGVAGLMLGVPAVGQSAGAAATAASAHVNGGPTRIVWSRFADPRSGTAAIVIADARGAGQQQLTHPARGIVDIDPELSPDGRLVLFERDFPDGNTRIGLVRSDGTGGRLLNLGCADPCVGDQAPAFTSDGHHVVWTPVIGPFDPGTGNAASAVLWQARLDGTHRHRLSQPGIDGGFEDYHARFAPGRYLTFVRVRNADVKSAVFRMDRDGNDVRQLTPWSLDADEPDISPARSGPTRDLVVFETYGHGAPEAHGQSIATVSATCTSLRDCAARIWILTPGNDPAAQNFNPAWSPDGRRIAFVHFTPKPTGDIRTMNWHGTNRRIVSADPRFEFRPDWGDSPGSQQH